MNVVELARPSRLPCQMKNTKNANDYSKVNLNTIDELC